MSEQKLINEEKLSKNKDIVEKIDDLELVFKKQIEQLKRNAGIQDVPKPRGRAPKMIQKAHQIMANKIGYSRGISIDQFAIAMYGVSTWESRTKARAIMSQLRRKFDMPVYSVKPLGMGGKRKERYCILSNHAECKSVNTHLKKVKQGIVKSEKRVDKRKRQIKVKEKVKVST